MPGAAGSSPTSSGVRPGRGCRRCTGGCSEVPTRATPSSRASSMPSSAFTGSLAAGSPPGTSPTPAPTPGPAGGARLPTRLDARLPHSCDARPRRHHDRSVRPAHDAREPRPPRSPGVTPSRPAVPARRTPKPVRHALIGSAEDHVEGTNNNSRGRCAMKRTTGKSPGGIVSRTFGAAKHRIAHRRRRPSMRVRLRPVAAGVAFVVPFAMMAPFAATSAQAVAPVGNGFTVTSGDLAFILKQIKISERHTTTLTGSNPCGTLVNNPGGVDDGIPDAEQVPDILTSYGLRTVDGSCNNLKTDATATFAAADQVFPRLTTPVWRIPTADPTFPVPSSPTYQGTSNVVDTAPRTISNLIVDQTSTNPAAIAASGHPVRSQDPNTPSAVPCTTDPSPLPPAPPTTPGVPAGCTPSHSTLFIPNITTDVGLSPPFNSMFTFFGQFFDHGVDQTVKTGSSVFVPLRPDDPLITLGPDGVPNSGDEVNPAAGNAFMVITRAGNKDGGGQDATNTDTPWVDQSQTYTSHASHQVFLRQYTLNAGPDQILGTADDAPGTRPVATGSLLAGLGAGQTYFNSPDMTDGESTWASVKKQAHDVLGLQLTDADVTNIPMLATDPY